MYSTSTAIGIGVAIGVIVAFLLAALWVVLSRPRREKLRNDLEQAQATNSDQGHRLKVLKSDKAADQRMLDERATTISQQDRGMVALRQNFVHLQNEEAESQRALDRLERFNRRMRAERDQILKDAAETRAEVSRLEPFEIEANRLRPRVQELKSLLRSRERQLEDLAVQLRKTEEKRELLLSRFDFVSQKMIEQTEVASETKLKLQTSLLEIESLK
jgi:hypothetical protein